MNNKGVFTFFLCDIDTESDSLSIFENPVEFGRYKLFTDKRTPIQCAKKGNRELLIYGYATDVLNGNSEDLPGIILNSTETIQDITDYEFHLGGKYIIFYSDENDCYCLGDATCSVPVFYTVGLKGFACGCNQKLIVDCFDLSPDTELQKIRNSGPLNQAMPYDVTSYREIKQLLPNHFVRFSNQKAARFVNSTEKQKRISPQGAAQITVPMIKNIVNMYLSHFKPACPITSGRDSRVVLAFLRNQIKEVETYTFWQEHFSQDEQDWVIPLELANLGKINHTQIKKENITENMKSSMDKILGVNGYPQDAFTVSATIDKNYPGYAIMEGDIIGQVGKCSLHRDIPVSLATSSYFRCKLHNYSKEAKKLLALWKKEIKKSKEKVNLFDLFSIENRLGVWAAQTNLVRNAMGQISVNIFNSRSIIYVWTAVKRSERMKSSIHIELIKSVSPDLLEVPFEKEKNAVMRFARSNWLFFYFATFAKYYIQKRKFVKK